MYFVDGLVVGGVFLLMVLIVVNVGLLVMSGVVLVGSGMGVGMLVGGSFKVGLVLVIGLVDEDDKDLEDWCD